MKRVLVVLVLWLLPGVAMAQLTMSFGSSNVTISGMSKGGSVTLVSLTRDVDDWTAKVTPLSALLTDTDGDGSETYELGRSVIKRSLWVAVDMSTGGAIVVSPGLAGVQSKLDPSEAIQLGKGGLYSLLADKRTVLDLTVVRPKVGAWHIRAWDGGKNDADQTADGTILIDSLTMTPMLPGGRGLQDFQAGDVLLGLDHSSLEFYAVPVVNPPGGKARG